ncbi:hypothetical protein D3C76_622240 [compost metagenome]
MTQSLMHKLTVEVTWVRSTPDSDETHMAFKVDVDKGEVYKETEKQFMVGEGRYKSRVMKTEYMTMNHWYGESPSWQKFHIWAKTEDILAAKKMAKNFMQERYQKMREDVVQACHAIAAYNPEAADA